MRLGLGLPNTLPGADGDAVLTWARAAEDGPFSSIAVFDRLVYDSTDPLATLAGCVGVTDEIELVTSIVAGPIRPTAVLAKQAATIDVLSGGRLTLGLALGARREDYERANASFDDRGQRFSRQLHELRELWSTDEVGPRPVQDGGPRLLIGGQSDPTFRRVGRYGDGYIHGGGPPRLFERQAAKARTAWEEAGRPGSPELWGHGYFALGDEAAEAGRAYLLDYYAFTGPFAERIADGLLTTEQEILQFARGYQDTGCDELLLFPTVADRSQYDRVAALIEDEWA